MQLCYCELCRRSTRSTNTSNCKQYRNKTRRKSNLSKSKMFDVEQFIVEVKQRPVLWNKKHPEYSHRQIKLAAWEQVAMNMYVDSENWSNYDKFGKVKDIQKRWSDLTDNYARELKYERKVDKGMAQPKKRKYVYSQLLSFLHSPKKKDNNESVSNQSSSDLDGSDAKVDEIPETTIVNDMIKKLSNEVMQEDINMERMETTDIENSQEHYSSTNILDETDSSSRKNSLEDNHNSSRKVAPDDGLRLCIRPLRNIPSCGTPHPSRSVSRNNHHSLKATSSLGNHLPSQKFSSEDNDPKRKLFTDGEFHPSSNVSSLDDNDSLRTVSPAGNLARKYSSDDPHSSEKAFAGFDHHSSTKGSIECNPPSSSRVPLIGGCRLHDYSLSLEQDDDRMFLLSLLPYFKKLNEERKLEARITVTKLLRDLIYKTS